MSVDKTEGTSYVYELMEVLAACMIIKSVMTVSIFDLIEMFKD
jgi:hypothetical protein